MCERVWGSGDAGRNTLRATTGDTTQDLELAFWLEPRGGIVSPNSNIIYLLASQRKSR